MADKPITSPDAVSLQLANFLGAADRRERENLEALIAKAAVFEKCALPADGLTAISALKGELNAALAKLKDQPLDMVKCAQEVGGALEWLNESYQRCSQIYGMAMEKLTAALASVQGMKPASELNALVETEVTARVGRGDLLTKEKHTDLLTGAVAAARKDGQDAARRIAARTTELNTAGVPLPGEDVLGLPDDQFALVFASAKKVTTELNSIGLAPTGNLAGLPWDKEERVIERMADLKAGAVAAGASGKTFRDPMEAGGAAPAPATVHGVVGCA